MRQKNWIGHVLRGNGLLKEVIEGRIEGRRPRGRRRICMLDELKGGGYYEMKRRLENRDEWGRWKPRTCLMAEIKTIVSF